MQAKEPRAVSTFTFGRVWISSEQWICQDKTRGGKCCHLPTNLIVLFAEEVARIASDLPTAVIGNQPLGPEAAAYILHRGLGTFVCDKHVRKYFKKSSKI